MSHVTHLLTLQVKRYDDKRSSDAAADGSTYDYNNDNDRENFCPASQGVGVFCPAVKGYVSSVLLVKG